MNYNPEANIRFIRNGEEFSGKEAREHMQKKWNYAKDKIKKTLLEHEFGEA